MSYTNATQIGDYVISENLTTYRIKINSQYMYVNKTDDLILAFKNGDVIPFKRKLESRYENTNREQKRKNDKNISKFINEMNKRKKISENHSNLDEKISTVNNDKVEDN